MQVKDKRIEELEEQVCLLALSKLLGVPEMLNDQTSLQLRSLMTCLETQNSEKHSSTSDEPTDSNSEVVVAETSSESVGRGAKKTNGRRKKK